jgi:high affinity sulfate transporter 1
LLAYQRSWLAGDLVAGLTITALTIPSALGYAEVAGLPAVYGLYAALVPMLVFGLLGTSRHLIIAPDGAYAALLGATLATAGLAADRVGLAALIGLLVGIFFVVFGVLRLGFLAAFFSRPLMDGFMTGLAITIVVSQLPKILGVSIDADTTIERILDLIGEAPEAELWSVVLGISTIVLTLALGRRFRRVPVALLLLVVGAVLVAAFDLEDDGVALLGEIPTGLPPLAMPSLGLRDIREVLGGALALAIIGFADLILQSRRYASEGGYEVDPSRDLVAAGASNVAAAFTSGYAVGASASRSAASLASGAKSTLASIIAAVGVGLCLLYLGPLLEELPLPVLAGVVAAAAIRLMAWGEIVALWSEHRSEFWVAVAAVAGVVAAGVLPGVGIALGLSLLGFVRRAAFPEDAVLGQRPGMPGWYDQARHQVTSPPGMLIYRFSAPLFFANADIFHDRVLHLVDEAEKAGEPVRLVLVHATAITNVDATASAVLARLTAELEERGIELAVSGAFGPLRDRLADAVANGRLPEHRVFKTINEAVAWFEGSAPA